MDPLRRKILEAGAAAAAIATAPRVLAQTGSAEGTMSFYERGPVRIHYEVTGSGFPLMLIAGGGLNSTIAGLKSGSPFNPIDEFNREFRCIAADLRNANNGYSSGPLEVDPQERRLAELAYVLGPLVDLLGFVLAEQQRFGHFRPFVRR